MKHSLIKVVFALVLACALGLTLFARVKKVNAEVEAGNRAFAAADYETALQHYTEAQSQAPGQAEPLYNAANVFYKQQALDQAQQSLDQALAQPQKTVEAFIHYNLGNVAYTAQQFDAAVTQYESSLRIDPTDQAAKYNLELALLQQKQQQDSKEGQDPKADQDQQDGQQDQQERISKTNKRDRTNKIQRWAAGSRKGQDPQDGQQDQPGSKEGQDPKSSKILKMDSKVNRIPKRDRSQKRVKRASRDNQASHKINKQANLTDRQLLCSPKRD